MPNTGHRNTGNYNTGDYNTGDWNTGNWNTGNWNTGDWNTGNYNTGNYNTGDWNTASDHVGCFNTLDPEMAYYFNKLIPVSEWLVARKPNWLYSPTLTTWVESDDMTEEEKSKYPEHETTGGYLRKNDMKEEWQKAYSTASAEDIQAVRDLPGFDADVFFEITGLDLRTPDDEIVINGVTYVKKK